MDFFFSFLIAFLVAFLLTPVCTKLLCDSGFVDQPHRPHPAVLHKTPIPRGGGLPVLVAFLSSITLVFIFSPDLQLTKAVVGIVLSCVLLVALGLADDKFDLNPYVRLLANLLIVAIVIGAGIGLSSFTNPFGGNVRLDTLVYHFSLSETLPLVGGAHSVVVFADIVAFVWIVWIMNAMNWSSGVDGQLTGIAVIALSLLGFVSASLATGDTVQLLPATLAFAAAGAFLGFLPSSFFPQKIMPGYGGATLAGFLIAVLAILAGAKLASVLLVILIPLIDSVWAVVRRTLGGHSPVWGDSFHLHHQLLRMGWTVPQICLFYYTIAFAFGLLALQLDSEAKFFAIAILGALIFSALFTIFFIVRRFDFRKNV